MRDSIPMLIALAFIACDDSPGAGADTTAPDTHETADTTVDTTSAEVDDDTTAEPSDTLVEDTLVEDTTVVDTATDTQSGSSYELGLGGWTMQAHEETTRCVVMRLGNSEPIRVNRIRTSLGKGSHHFIVYRSGATEERAAPFACSPFTEALGGSTIPLVISQIREDAVALPDGVTYSFEANQMIRLEAHYLNYYPDEITADAKVWFDTVPETAVTETADILFYGTLSISLPKGESVTNPWSWFDVPQGLSLFAMTGHTHALGTNVEVERTTSAATAGTPVYPPDGETFAWDSAPVAHFDPALAFTQSGDGFRFRCSWTNTTDQHVGFGESATREMCFFWGYYWPSRGPIIRF